MGSNFSRPLRYAPYTQLASGVLVLSATVTPPTLGTGSQASGAYAISNGLCYLWFRFQFGFSGVNAGNGLYRITLPTGSIAGQPDLRMAALQNTLPGNITLSDFSALTTTRNCLPDYVSATQFQIITTGSTSVTHAVPWAWTNDDGLFGNIVYPLLNP